MLETSCVDALPAVAPQNYVPSAAAADNRKEDDLTLSSVQGSEN